MQSRKLFYSFSIIAVEFHVELYCHISIIQLLIFTIFKLAPTHVCLYIKIKLKCGVN